MSQPSDRAIAVLTSGGLDSAILCAQLLGGFCLHCGRCNKCAERQQGFYDAGILDLTPYAVQLS